MEFLDDEFDFDELRAAMQELQSLLDHSVPKLDEPDAKLLIGELSSTYRDLSAKFLNDFPATLEGLEKEISSIDKEMQQQAEQSQQPAAAESPVELDFGYDPNFGATLRDGLLKKFGLKPQASPASHSLHAANALELSDFWAISSATLSRIASQAKKPNARSKDSSNDSWVQWTQDASDASDGT